MLSILVFVFLLMSPGYVGALCPMAILGNFSEALTSGRYHSLQDGAVHETFSVPPGPTHHSDPDQLSNTAHTSNQMDEEIKDFQSNIRSGQEIPGCHVAGPNILIYSSHAHRQVSLQCMIDGVEPDTPKTLMSCPDFEATFPKANSTETQPPRLSTVQTYACLKIQDDLDEWEEEEKTEGGKREKTEKVATDANLFCELSLDSTSRESALINTLVAGDHDLTLTCLDISRHISGLNVRYSAEQNAIIFSFQLCAARIPTEAVLRHNYFGEGAVTIVSKIKLANQPHYATYLASLADTGLDHHVSQLRVLFKSGSSGEQLRHPDKLLVSFDVDPMVVVPEYDLVHEDVEEWDTRMQQRDWFPFECEGIFSPPLQLEPEMPPEDPSAQVPLYIKQRIPYQPAGRDTGSRSEGCMRYESNSHPFARVMAATPEEVSHRLCCLISRLNINQDTRDDFWNMVI